MFQTAESRPSSRSTASVYGQETRQVKTPTDGPEQITNARKGKANTGATAADRISGSWEEVVQHRSAWLRTVKAGHRNFRLRIDLVGHLRMQCTIPPKTSNPIALNTTKFPPVSSTWSPPTLITDAQLADAPKQTRVNDVLECTLADAAATSIREFSYDPDSGVTFDDWFKGWEDIFCVEFAEADYDWNVPCYYANWALKRTSVSTKPSTICQITSESYLILATFHADFVAQMKCLTITINDKPVRLHLQTASDMSLIFKRTWRMIIRPPMITLDKKDMNVCGRFLRLNAGEKSDVVASTSKVRKDAKKEEELGEKVPAASGKLAARRAKDVVP
ncbi:unnamed protein product [Dibothriocephalus latus]|uniref:Uncharacterized protein n=1 Tax=Dibothriocephalus latus TaxID=60516 RepID=A0A3P6U583_DIBLA|nr:unnamed protein product [Dibothriocephalus latus]